MTQTSPAFTQQTVVPDGVAKYWTGAAYALCAVSIWSGWFIATRFNVSDGLTAYDLVAIRYSITLVVLLPLAARLRHRYLAVRRRDLVMMFAGSGAIYGVCITAATAFAPAAEGAALTPGVMPLATALLSTIAFRERLGQRRIVGFCFTIAGVTAIAGIGLIEGVSSRWVGHVLFLCGAFLFASYTVALKRSKLTGLEAAAVVALISCVTYLPIYVAALHPNLAAVPSVSLIFPLVYQGLLTNVVSLVAYGRAVAILGASRASAFAAFVPVFTLLLAIPFLHEIPSLADCAGIFLVSLGVLLTSGAPLPKFRMSF